MYWFVKYVYNITTVICFLGKATGDAHKTMDKIIKVTEAEDSMYYYLCSFLNLVIEC